MKYYLTRPSDPMIQRLIDTNHSQACTHAGVGTTLQWKPDDFASMPVRRDDAGYLWQFNRGNVGSGAQRYQRCRDWIRDGEAFNLNWVECHKQRRFAEGDTFALIARVFLAWVGNACRIVYVDEQVSDDQSFFSVGIGTLPVHAAIGEERLAVHWNHTTDEVDFMIGSFSRPKGLIPRLFESYMRVQQQRFAEDAVRRLRAIADDKPIFDAGATGDTSHSVRHQPADPRP